MQAGMHHTEAPAAIRNGTVGGTNVSPSGSSGHWAVASGGDHDERE